MKMIEGGMVAQATHMLGTDVVAAGELRQGKTPAPDAVASFSTLLEVLRPRRSKSLPRRFVLAVTADRVAAFKAIATGEQDSHEHNVYLRGAEYGSWPRSEVWIADAPEGAKARGGTLYLGGEQIPVFRPLLSGDPETDELFRLLAKA